MENHDKGLLYRLEAQLQALKVTVETLEVSLRENMRAQEAGHMREHDIRLEAHDKEHLSLWQAIDRLVIMPKDKGSGLAWGVAIGLAGLGLGILGFLASR